MNSAEAALIDFECKDVIEGEVPSIPHITWFFTRENYETREKRKRRSLWFWKNEYGYSECFRMVFWSFGGTGLVIALNALINYLTA